MDNELGLSDREKELRKWNAPYVYREFPKMLFRGTLTAGRIDVEQRIVGSEAEERAATDTGWLPTSTRAYEAESARQEALGTAAAERAGGDRRLSAKARAEAQALDETTVRHLPEIPERPRKRRGRKPRVKPVLQVSGE